MNAYDTISTDKDIDDALQMNIIFSKVKLTKISDISNPMALLVKI